MDPKVTPTRHTEELPLLVTLARDPQLIETLVQELEASRRLGNGTLNVSWSPTSTIDYASAGTKIDTAVHHLDEALPNGQLQRSVLAFKLLKLGVAELEAFFAERGVQT